MLDIKRVRKEPEAVKAAVRSRNGNLDKEIDELLEIDKERRAVTQLNDSLKQKQNEASKKIPQIKKEGGDIQEILTEMSKIKEQVKENNEKLSSLEGRQKEIMLEIPNVPHESVPLGKDDTENVESPQSLTSSPRPIGTSALISAFWTRILQQRSPEPVSISIKDRVLVWREPSSTTILTSIQKMVTQRFFRPSW